MQHYHNIEIQSKYWPPVTNYHKTRQSISLSNFSKIKIEEQKKYLNSLHQDEKWIITHKLLSDIFAYYYGYRDRCLYNQTDSKEESLILQSKCVLIEFYINNILNIQYNLIASESDAISNISYIINQNSGINHDFFEYIENEMPLDAFIEFLKLEVCRNEIVDDEVALLTVGLQGHMKSVIASNLWDECGNGRLHKFHTYWLRLLISQLNIYDDIINYRETEKPWFANISSNTFNSLLTTPAYKMRAYGHFLTTEAWVNQHFTKVINGLKRVGLYHQDISIYFDAHIGIDTRHTAEILHAINVQSPRLNNYELNEIIYGSKIAEKSGSNSYDLLLKYFKNKYKGQKND
ncbi:MAG: iron-containing redox enzyme family protein [Burkholderiales bacterium]|nr:iron-containing redox enzyme family protein [Burkholderiales bacterium]